MLCGGDGSLEAGVLTLNKTARSLPSRAIATDEGGIMVERWAVSVTASARLKIGELRTLGDPAAGSRPELSGR
jgi:hypothetical protein